MSTEGPLSRLSRLLGLKPLDPIAAVKRIEEQPVSLNPETLLGNKPLRRTSDARAFDLKFDYASYRPENARWICIDLNTYDGAPDSEAPCTFIGRGASEKEARMDLLAQFHEYDNPEPEPKPRPSRVIHSSAFEPPTYADKRDEDVDFDDGLDDAR